MQRLMAGDRLLPELVHLHEIPGQQDQGPPRPESDRAGNLGRGEVIGAHADASLGRAYTPRQIRNPARTAAQDAAAHEPDCEPGQSQRDADAENDRRAPAHRARRYTSERGRAPGRPLKKKSRPPGLLRRRRRVARLQRGQQQAGQQKGLPVAMGHGRQPQSQDDGEQAAGCRQHGDLQAGRHQIPPAAAAAEPRERPRHRSRIMRAIRCHCWGETRPSSTRWASSGSAEPSNTRRMKSRTMRRIIARRPAAAR